MVVCGCGVQGWGLRVGCMSDVDQLTVLVGGTEERCNITVITDTLIQCRPPQQQPSPALNHPLPRVTVRTHRPAYLSTISLSPAVLSHASRQHSHSACSPSRAKRSPRHTDTQYITRGVTVHYVYTNSVVWSCLWCRVWRGVSDRWHLWASMQSDCAGG